MRIKRELLKPNHLIEENFRSNNDSANDVDSAIQHGVLIGDS